MTATAPTNQTTSRRPDRATGNEPLRRITGFKPTGHLHLGNLLGAIRPIIAGQYDADAIVFLADLHALTVSHDPAALRSLTLEQAGLLLAAGLDPARSLLYVQSQVPQHTELHYLLECVTSYGEAHRMIQFKEKSATQRQVRLSLLTYPVLMAADILLHDSRQVPVGDDQRQHLELARDVAIRFNTRYGETFVVPEAVHPPVATRVMDLADPATKMGKTGGGTAGTVFLLDPPELIRRKFARAVTDSATGVDYDPATRPGVANLLEILAGCTGGSPAALAGEFSGYGQLKSAVAEAVIEVLRPIQARYAELIGDQGHLRRVLDDSAERAQIRADGTVRRARAALGLLG